MVKIVIFGTCKKVGSAGRCETPGTFHTLNVGFGSSSLPMKSHFCSIMRIILRTSPHIPHNLKNRQMLSTAATSVMTVMIVAIVICILIFK